MAEIDTLLRLRLLPLPTQPPNNVRMAGSLELAYVGDTVYDLFVRTRLALKGYKAADMHRLATERVCAGAQAAAFNAVKDMLSEEELAVAKRARNAPHRTLPKHAPPEDYNAATALEAVIGYLYLSGRAERIREIMARIGLDFI